MVWLRAAAEVALATTAALLLPVRNAAIVCDSRSGVCSAGPAFFAAVGTVAHTAEPDADVVPGV